jgi:hypothetical protein
MRDRGLWLASLPAAGLFIALGVVSIHHHPWFAAACFIGAALLLMPRAIRVVVDRADALTGLRRRVAMTILGAFGVILVGGIFIAMATSGNHPPGSP